MNSTYKISLILAVPVMLASCGKNSGGGNSSAQHQALYERALELNDNSTAIVALNYLLLEDTNNIKYTDSLARMYIRNGLFEPGLRLGEKVMKKYPENYTMLELMAEARGTSGDFKTSKENFEFLYSKNKDIRYLYKLAIIESEQQDAQAFDKRLDQILIDPGTTTVEFPAVQGMQSVDIKAAANFLKAQLYFNSGNIEQSLAYVKKALAISPDFQSALVALEQIKEAKQGAGRSLPSKPLTKAQQDELNYKNYLKQKGMK